jgi:spore maturation protein CgeB
MAAAFERQGLTVTAAPEVKSARLTASDAVELLDKHRPDLLFSTNGLGSDPHGILPETCEQLGAGWATWLLDDPRFLLTPEEAEGAGRNRVAFCWDRNGVEGWEALGFRHSEALPLATDARAFGAGSAMEELRGRVVFVGSPRFSSAEGFFHLLDSDEHAIHIADRLRGDVMRTRRPPSHKQVSEAVESLGLEGHFEQETLRRLPAWIVQNANMGYRIRMLSALAPLSPIVYGDGWEGLLPDSVELRGLADYNRQLPDLYASDAVHLSLTNLQMRAWPNQRLFDVPAAGGLVICDRLEGLHELFGTAVDPLVFEDEHSLFTLAERLSDDPEERRALKGPMRERVLEQHTVDHRAATILERMS